MDKLIEVIRLRQRAKELEDEARRLRWRADELERASEASRVNA